MINGNLYLDFFDFAVIKIVADKILPDDLGEPAVLEVDNRLPVKHVVMLAYSDVVVTLARVGMVNHRQQARLDKGVEYAVDSRQVDHAVLRGNSLGYLVERGVAQLLHHAVDQSTLRCHAQACVPYYIFNSFHRHKVNANNSHLQIFCKKNYTVYIFKQVFICIFYVPRNL